MVGKGPHKKKRPGGITIVTDNNSKSFPKPGETSTSLPKNIHKELKITEDDLTLTKVPSVPLGFIPISVKGSSTKPFLVKTNTSQAGTGEPSFPTKITAADVFGGDSDFGLIDDDLQDNSINIDDVLDSL